jgi:hypothetical protein
MNLAELAQREIGRRTSERAQRREKWPIAAELADMFRDMQPIVTHAENEWGDEYGERFEARCVRENLIVCEVRL